MADEQRSRTPDVVDRPAPEVTEPTLFRVVLHNDDYTTMDFVVEVLESVFLMHPAEAYGTMMQVHCQGRGVCGLYPHEIAETKVAVVHRLARRRGFPLMASVEQV